MHWFEQVGGTYQIASFNCKTNAIGELCKVSVKSRNALPTIHFPREACYLVSLGDGDFSFYMENVEKFSATLPEISDNTDTVLVNDVKLDSEHVHIAYTFVVGGDEKCAMVIYAIYDIENGKIVSVEKFHSAAVPGYVAIAADYSVVIASDKIVKHKCDEIEEKAKKVLYKWRQSLSDVIIFVEFERKLEKSEINISISKNNLVIKIRDLDISGKLFQPIDPDGSTWTISEGGVEIILQKGVERGWAQVMEDRDDGEEIYNAEFVAQVHQKIGHLTSDHPMTPFF